MASSTGIKRAPYLHLIETTNRQSHSYDAHLILVGGQRVDQQIHQNGIRSRVRSQASTSPIHSRFMRTTRSAISGSKAGDSSGTASPVDVTPAAFRTFP